MANPGYLSVKNWDRFQQYKDGRPMLFIRVDVGVLDDYEIDQLTEVQQNHLMRIWLLAGRRGNKITNDAAWIAKKIGAKSKVDINHLVTCGFLEAYETVQDCTEPYKIPLEKIREEKIREEKKAPKKRASALPQDWILPDDYRQYCKTKRPDLCPDATAENFHDYYIGEGKLKVDWKRTWQTWVRKEYGNTNKKTNGSSSGTIQTPADRHEEAVRRRQDSHPPLGGNAQVLR